MKNTFSWLTTLFFFPLLLFKAISGEEKNLGDLLSPPYHKEEEKDLRAVFSGIYLAPEDAADLLASTEALDLHALFSDSKDMKMSQLGPRLFVFQGQDSAIDLLYGGKHWKSGDEFFIAAFFLSLDSGDILDITKYLPPSNTFSQPPTWPLLKSRFLIARRDPANKIFSAYLDIPDPSRVDECYFPHEIHFVDGKSTDMVYFDGFTIKQDGSRFQIHETVDLYSLDPKHKKMNLNPLGRQRYLNVDYNGKSIRTEKYVSEQIFYNWRLYNFGEISFRFGDAINDKASIYWFNGNRFIKLKDEPYSHRKFTSPIIEEVDFNPDTSSIDITVRVEDMNQKMVPDSPLQIRFFSIDNVNTSFLFPGFSLLMAWNRYASPQSEDIRLHFNERTFISADYLIPNGPIKNVHSNKKGEFVLEGTGSFVQIRTEPEQGDPLTFFIRNKNLEYMQKVIPLLQW